MKLSTQFKILAAAAVVAGSALIAVQSASAGSFDLQNMYAQAGGAGGAGGAAGGTGGAGTSGSNGASSQTGGADTGRENLSKGLPDPSSPSVGIPAHCAAMADANQRQACINQARSGDLRK